MSKLKVNDIEDLAGNPFTGVSDPIVSAWATVSGTGNLTEGLNVASVTRPSTGRYDYVFATPMPNSAYAVTATAISSGNRLCTVQNKTTTGFRIETQVADTDNNINIGHMVIVAASNATLPNPVTKAQVAKAWVNFNGSGTVSIRDSFNVSSITDDGTGLYTINFTNPMSDTNYAMISGGSSGTATGGSVNFVIAETTSGVTRTTSSIQIRSQMSNGSNVDRVVISVAIFGS